MESCTRLHTPEVSRSRRRFAGSDEQLASRMVCLPGPRPARPSALSTTPVPRSRRDPSSVAPGPLSRTPRRSAEWSAGHRPVSATCPCSTRHTGGNYLGLYHAQLGRGADPSSYTGFDSFTVGCADRLRGSTPHGPSRVSVRRALPDLHAQPNRKAAFGRPSDSRLWCRQDAGATRLPMCDAAGNSRGVAGLRKNRSEPTGSPLYLVWDDPAFPCSGGSVRHPVDIATCRAASVSVSTSAPHRVERGRSSRSQPTVGGLNR